MAPKENIEAVRLRIDNERTGSTKSNLHWFVPQTALEHIFTASAIARCVAEVVCEVEDRIGLAAAIESHGTTIFAILIWMRQEDAIVAFRRSSCLDRLPLDLTTALLVAPDFGRNLVEEHQWHFLPHSFREDEDIEIDPLVILPFMREIGQTEGGGFGTINRLELHPTQHDFNKASPLLQARRGAY
jgi:hypothetical protein